MRGNRRVDTAPEIAVRRALHRAGHRFRKDFSITAGNVRVRPDVVFTRARLAVFIDGCFWHGCPTHGNQPKANAEYWRLKLRRNAERDARVNAALIADGWGVIRVWEHEDPLAVERKVAARLAEQRRAPGIRGTT